MSWTTSLSKIEEHKPNADGWNKLLSFLGKTEADDAPLELLTILEACGTEFAIWCLRAIEGHEKEKALFAIACAERGLPIYEEAYPDDSSARDLLNAARDYTGGLLGLEELQSAATESYVYCNKHHCVGKYAANFVHAAISGCYRVARPDNNYRWLAFTLIADNATYAAIAAATYAAIAAAEEAAIAAAIAAAYAAELSALGELLKKMVRGEL